jgi:hypothetical protein
MQCLLSAKKDKMGEMAEYSMSPEYEGDMDWYTPKPWMRTCNFCKERGLRFMQLPSGKWWLHNSKGEYHLCKRPNLLNKASL